MYFKQKNNVLYRDYNSFGYITDNRNFNYKLLNDKKNPIGDKVVSESGAVFLSALSRRPQSIDELVSKICNQYTDTDKEIIKADAIGFYSMLETEGFVVSGKTKQECYDNEQYSLYHGLAPEGKQETENTTQLFFETYFNNVPQLTNVHIEIISKCNERCLHCYIPHENKTDIMTPGMFYKLLEQCRDMNVLHLTISGGEPMAHINFIDFLQKCNEYNFSVNILSNLTLLNPEIIEEMQRNPLLGVQTSLYSMNADVHDAITQTKGSFAKTKAAILTMLENSIPVQISCPIMKQNMNCYEEVIEWGRQHNVNVNSDYVIIARYDHGTQNLNCRLSKDNIREIINQEADNNPNYLELLEKEYKKKKEAMPDDYVCSVCHSSICISENGKVYPCAGWQGYVVGDIKEKKLEDIWNESKEIKYLRELRRRDFIQCMECSEKEFCTMCMVRNANENPSGNPLEVNKFFCDIAKINKEIYFGKK